ncbi:hypothetical protein A5748_15740 [Nocardia sp. 852002-51244_SCH5132740]|nr:hypothetical protein A5748_15740 [Nocardia sp. 852002-51244_SCH5132740]
MIAIDWCRDFGITAEQVNHQPLKSAADGTAFGPPQFLQALVSLRGSLTRDSWLLYRTVGRRSFPPADRFQELLEVELQGYLIVEICLNPGEEPEGQWDCATRLDYQKHRDPAA